MLLEFAPNLIYTILSISQSLFCFVEVVFAMMRRESEEFLTFLSLSFSPFSVI